jgi:hypothetical protein
MAKAVAILPRISAGAVAGSTRFCNLGSASAAQLARFAGIRAAAELSRSLRPQPGRIYSGTAGLVK